ncbi:MAG: hypothetical protein KatS3mg113_0979 [Planctomycetaceae bacterium]|nr:MAG: hypothetical protein KatS3mg113_0979 [Planctomycetaceae bacterium]
MDWQRIGIICFLSCYLLAWGWEFTRLRGWWKAGWWGSLLTGMSGFIAHTVYLLNRAQQTHLPPLLSSLRDWILVVSWLIVLVTLFFHLLDRESAVGLLSWPVTVLFISASPWVPALGGSATLAHRSWSMLHVSMLALGVMGVLLGFLVSLMYLWQHRRLKHQQFSPEGMHLPNLERLARWNRWLLLFSVPCLTIGMITGFGLAVLRHRQWGETLSWSDPLIVIGLTSWFVMIGLLTWLMTHRHTPGRQMAWLTLWSTGFLLLTTVGSQLAIQVAKLPAVHATPPKGRLVEPHSPVDQAIQETRP